MSKEPRRDTRSTTDEVERLTKILLENLVNAEFTMDEQKPLREMIKSLVEHTAKVDDTNAIELITICLHLPVAEIGFLEYVLERGGSKVINNLIEEVDATALHVAGAKGQIDFIQLLLKYGANINAIDKCGATALHYAAGLGLEEMTKLLIDSKADVNIAAENGKTAMHLSKDNGFSKITKLLVDGGAKVNAISKTGETALHMSISKGSNEMVRLLLDSDSKVDEDISRLEGHSEPALEVEVIGVDGDISSAIL